MKYLGLLLDLLIQVYIIFRFITWAFLTQTNTLYEIKVFEIKEYLKLVIFENKGYMKLNGILDYGYMRLKDSSDLKSI